MVVGGGGGVWQFGGVPVWPAGHVLGLSLTQLGGVPVVPAGHMSLTQLGGVPDVPAGHLGGAVVVVGGGGHAGRCLVV